MKLFLDDVRNPIDCAKYMYKRIGHLNPIYLTEWVVVRNYKDFREIVERDPKIITHVSFDHDLADAHYHESMFSKDRKVYMKYIETVAEKTGLDCAKFLKEHFASLGLPLPTLFVHSMNPVGTQNIIDLFNDKRTSQRGTPESS